MFRRRIVVMVLFFTTMPVFSLTLEQLETLDNQVEIGRDLLDFYKTALVIAESDVDACDNLQLSYLIWASLSRDIYIITQAFGVIAAVIITNEGKPCDAIAMRGLLVNEQAKVLKENPHVREIPLSFD